MPAIWMDGRKYDVCACCMTDSTRQQIAVELAARAVARASEGRRWKAWRNVWALIALVFFAACATGPRRVGLLGGDEVHGLSEEDKASPLSVGPMLAVVAPFNGEAVRPAELLSGTVRLNSEGRAVNAVVFGGFASKSFSALSEGGLTGGLGASLELTPGNLLYSVDVGGGVVFGDFGPAACLGLTIQTKM